MFTSLSKKDLIRVYFFFISYFIIGIFAFDNYGFAFDEDIQRKIGESNLNYIINFFNLSHNVKKEILYPYYGISFEALALLIEKFLGLEDLNNQYQLRHLLIFFFCFIGSVFFFLLLLKRFNSVNISLVGCLFLILSPRIFAESFYNSKDIILMHSFIISFYFSILFLENPKKKNIFLFSFFSAFLINVRIVGLILPILILIVFFLKYFRSDYKKFFSNFFLYLILLIFFTILMWPFLWNNPINNFINAFLIFKSYNIDIYNFYLSNYVYAKNLYWHYIPIWISVTTPPVILIFFIIGLFFLTKRIFQRLVNINNSKPLNDLWRGNYEMIDLITLILVVIPVGLVITFNSTLYNGWRHLYFIYPFIILVSINPIYRFYFFHYKLKKILFLILAISFVYYSHWNFKFHPFQYSYFNIFAGKEAHLKFDVDYWGLSNKYALEYIIKNHNLSKNKIYVSNVSDTSLILNINLLDKNKKNIIEYTGAILESDFIIDNNIFFRPSNKRRREILKKFDIFHELVIDNTLITRIYKKRT